jgi:tRNA A37 methylthiotransferase MiaB
VQVRALAAAGVKEVTLLGQNVNSYADFSSSPAGAASAAPAPPPRRPRDEAAFDRFYAPGFRSVYKPRREGAAGFAALLAAVAAVDEELRVRFTSPHPKDFTADVLAVMAARPNVCRQLHMPAQSGADGTLERMRRGYSRAAFDALVAAARAALPGVALSTDMIAGYCGESEAEHAASVDLLEKTRFEAAYLFAYSERAKTPAARRLANDVPDAVKKRRLAELIAAHRAGLAAGAAAEVGRRHLVLVEGPARRGAGRLTGRTDTGKRAVFADAGVADGYAVGAAGGAGAAGPHVRLAPGDYVAVQVVAAGEATLVVAPLARTTLAEFVAAHGSAVPPEWHAALPAAAAAAAVA